MICCDILTSDFKQLPYADNAWFLHHQILGTTSYNNGITVFFFFLKSLSFFPIDHHVFMRQYTTNAGLGKQGDVIDTMYIVEIYDDFGCRRGFATSIMNQFHLIWGIEASKGTQSMGPFGVNKLSLSSCELNIAVVPFYLLYATLCYILFHHMEEIIFRRI
ncbi:hypothetical protein ACJX0J_012542, partial [Zea mays]